MTVTARQQASPEHSSGLELTEVLEMLAATGRRKSDASTEQDATAEDREDWVHMFHELAPEMFHLPS